MSVTKTIMRAINSSIASAGNKRVLEPIAKELVKDIKERTREGIEVKEDNGGNTGKFKKLETSTIRRRKSIQRKGGLDSRTDSNKSNQTLKGKMVDSTKQKTKFNEIVISVDKGQEKKLLGNQKIGRNFLRLSKKNLSGISNTIGNFVARLIEGKLK